MPAQEASKFCRSAKVKLRRRSPLTRSLASTLALAIFLQPFGVLAAELRAHNSNAGEAMHLNTLNENINKFFEELMGTSDAQERFLKQGGQMPGQLGAIGSLIKEWDNEEYRRSGKWLPQDAMVVRPYAWGSTTIPPQNPKKTLPEESWTGLMMRAGLYATEVQKKLDDPKLDAKEKAEILATYVQKVQMPMRQFLTLTYNKNRMSEATLKKVQPLINKLEVSVDRKDFPAFVFQKETKETDEKAPPSPGLQTKRLEDGLGIKFTDAPKSPTTATDAGHQKAVVKLAPLGALNMDLGGLAKAPSKINYMRSLRTATALTLLRQIAFADFILGRKESVQIPQGCQGRDGINFPPTMPTQESTPEQRKEALKNILVNGGMISGGLGSAYDGFFRGSRSAALGEMSSHGYSSDLAHDAAIERGLLKRGESVLGTQEEPWLDPKKDYEHILRQAEPKLRAIAQKHYGNHTDSFIEELKTFPEGSGESINLYLARRMKERGLSDWRALFCRSDDEGNIISDSSEICKKLHSEKVYMSQMPPYDGPERAKFFAAQRMIQTCLSPDVKLKPDCSTKLFGFTDTQKNQIAQALQKIAPRRDELSLSRIKFTSIVTPEDYKLLQRAWVSLTEDDFQLSESGGPPTLISPRVVDNGQNKFEYMSNNMSENPWVAMHAAYLLEHEYRKNGTKITYPVLDFDPRSPIGEVNIPLKQLLRDNGYISGQSLNSLSIGRGQEMQIALPASSLSLKTRAQLFERNRPADAVFGFEAPETSSQDQLMNSLRAGRIRVVVPKAGTDEKAYLLLREHNSRLPELEYLQPSTTPQERLLFPQALSPLPLKKPYLVPPLSNGASNEFTSTLSQANRQRWTAPNPYDLKLDQLLRAPSDRAPNGAPIPDVVAKVELFRSDSRPWEGTAFDEDLEEIAKTLGIHYLEGYRNSYFGGKEKSKGAFESVMQESNEQTNGILNSENTKRDKTARQRLAALQESVLLRADDASTFARGNLKPSQQQRADAEIQDIFKKRDADGRLAALYDIYQDRKRSLTDASNQPKPDGSSGPTPLRKKIEDYITRYGDPQSANHLSTVKDSFMAIDSEIKEKLGSRIIRENAAEIRKNSVAMLEKLCALDLQNDASSATTEEFKKLFLQTHQAQNTVNAMLGLPAVPDEVTDIVKSKDWTEWTENSAMALQLVLAAGAITCTVVSGGLCLAVTPAIWAATYGLGVVNLGAMGVRAYQASGRAEYADELVKLGATTQEKADEYANAPSKWSIALAIPSVLFPMNAGLKGAGALGQARRLGMARGAVTAEVAEHLDTLNLATKAERLALAKGGDATAMTNLVYGENAATTITRATSERLATFVKDDAEGFGDLILSRIADKLERYRKANIMVYRAAKVGQKPSRLSLFSEYGISPLKDGAAIQREVAELKALEKFATALKDPALKDPQKFRQFLEKSLNEFHVLDKTNQGGNPLSMILESMPGRWRELPGQITVAAPITKKMRMPWGLNQATHVKEIMGAYNFLMRESTYAQAARKFGMKTADLTERQAKVFWGFKSATDNKAFDLAARLQVAAARDALSAETQGLQLQLRAFNVQRKAFVREVAEKLAIEESKAMAKESGRLAMGGAEGAYASAAMTRNARSVERWVEILEHNPGSLMGSAAPSTVTASDLAEASVLLEKVSLKEVVQSRVIPMYLKKGNSAVDAAENFIKDANGADDLEAFQELLLALRESTARGTKIPLSPL